MTTNCLAAFSDPVGFEHEYGVTRSQVATGDIKLVLAGEKRGELRAIESEYLEPEVHSLMEVKGFVARAGDCSRLIFLAPSPKGSLKKWAKAYVKWGEERGVHLGSTCAQRVTKEKEWFDLTGHRRGVAYWPKSQQYKHAIPLNSDDLQANCNLYDLFPVEGVSGKAFTALLNSTLVILSKHQFGRPVGVEGNLKTEIVDVSMMLVPDLRRASPKTIRALEVAMDTMAEREPKQLLSERRLRTMAFEKSGKHAELELLPDDCELDMPDRRALDHVVLELLGVKTKKERDEWINRLYDYLRQLFEETRRKEEQAIINKNTSKRKGAVSPQDLATQLSTELNAQEPNLFRSYKDFFNESGVGDSWIAKEVPAEGAPEMHADLHDVGVRFSRGKKQTQFVSMPSEAHAALAVVAIREMRRETVQLPRSDMLCSSLLRDYQAFLDKRGKRLRQVIAERVADEEVQATIYALLVAHVRRGARAPLH